jgi:hypothetical protein
MLHAHRLLPLPCHLVCRGRERNLMRALHFSTQLLSLRALIGHRRVHSHERRMMPALCGSRLPCGTITRDE